MAIRQGHGRLLVVSDDPVGAVLAQNVEAEVVFAGLNERVVAAVDDHVDETVLVTEPRRFEASVGTVDAAVVATGVDSLNLLYAQRLRVGEGVSTILSRVNDPQYHDTFSAVGATTSCATSAVGTALEETYANLVE